MRKDATGRSTTQLQAFCEDAARQMRGLETRLRTITAVTEPLTEVALLEEAVGSSLQIAKVMLDAGQRGQHERLLALRPLLRALSAIRV